MKCFIAWTVTLSVFITWTSAVNETLREEAKEYLRNVSRTLNELQHQYNLADWAFQTNVTDENQENLAYYQEQFNNFPVTEYPWTSFGDADMTRQAKKYGFLTPQSVYDKVHDTREELNNVISQMVETFSEETVCSYTDKNVCNLTFNPDLQHIFKTSTDPEELKYYWLTYQNKLGKDLKQLYSRYVKLSNKIAQIRNYTSRAEMWIEDYEGPPVAEFPSVMLGLYDQIAPLYKQIFAFVRKRLYDHYGGSVINRTGPIPAHLSGSLIAYSFVNIMDKVKPFPLKETTDVTHQLLQQNYTVKELAEVCNDFYQSLGIPGVPKSFYKNSQFEKPKDAVSSCFTAFWDMYDNHDYRILTCGEVNNYYLFALCHEMGHLMYAMGYKDQPFCYKEGANMAINEGWADVAGLSLSTTERLGKLGLLDQPCTVDPEVELNRLFFTALDKVSFLPYGLILELWRWGYFQGNITDDDCNTAWWELRLQFQGISPPEARSDDYIDPVCQSHVVDDDQYIMYFLATIFQFQFQESLCIEAKKYNPSDPKTQTLDKCDIYGSKKAGQLIKKMFNLGSSKSWQYALKAITGQTDIDARPILKYFENLYDWLKIENEKTGEYIGWM